MLVDAEPPPGTVSIPSNFAVGVLDIP